MSPGDARGGAARDRRPVQRILALDFSTYMPGSVLTRVDRASMAHGLEVRPPLLDGQDGRPRVPVTVPLQARRGRGKYLLKLARAARSPMRSSTDPRKGSAFRWRNWLRGALKDRSGRSSPARRCGTGASWTVRCSAPGTTSTRTRAPTARSRCGRCSCWTAGSVATGARPPASMAARRPRQPSDGARGSFEIRKR